MKRVWFIISWLLLLLAATGLAQTVTNGPAHFQAVDIYVDSGDAHLAAYQIEFKALNGNAKIVGVEGGEHMAFKEAPYYDSKAMQQERVILAAFSTDGTLPKGKTRVATVHMQVQGDLPPGYEVKLTAAADEVGNRIAGKASFAERKKP